MSKLIKLKTNYRDLLCYQKAETIYDMTYFFVNKFLERGDRTRDQMVQAARSGKQNIIEGYAASATSIESELKLMNVAKSSLQELYADYEDYLRVRHLVRWEQGSEAFQKAQELGRKHNESAFWMELIEERSDETIANLALILIHQVDFMLHKFIEQIGERFMREGGFREHLTRTRLQHRDKQTENN